jgi:hypothetical protein
VTLRNNQKPAPHSDVADLSDLCETGSKFNMSDWPSEKANIFSLFGNHIYLIYFVNERTALEGAKH